MSRQERDDAILRAIGHPIRRKIMDIMSQNTNGGISPKELSVQMGKPLGTVSYHVRLLARSEVIKLVGRKQKRGAIEHFYKRSGNVNDKRATELSKALHGKS